MAQKKRSTRPTLLAVGEGDSEEAFLKYLRRLYCSNYEGVSVTVVNAHGKGPGNVVSTAVGQLRNKDFDKALALLDTDLPWSPKDREAARRAKTVLIGSTPCLEGLLLKILGQAIPELSAQCKKRIATLVEGELTETDSYTAVFPKHVLDAAREKITELDVLLTLYEGKA